MERDPIPVLKLIGGDWIQQTSQEPASQASDSKTRGFFGGENDKFNRATWFVFGAHECTYSFKAAEHADCSVEAAGVGNSVDVRACAHGCEHAIRANPTRECVAHLVFSHSEPGSAAKAFDEFSAAQIRFGEDDARHHGRRFLGDCAQSVQL
jgi:hypothetical protein